MVKLNVGAGSGWLMNIFMVKNIALLVVGVKVIHGFWGNTSLHELSQCSSNYIFAAATSPQF